MIAMLGMYDLPALQGANDRFWQAIRTRLGAGPETLDRETDFWAIWRDPEMIFSQTCGMPYRTALHGTVQLVGTPDYDLPGCAPGYYNSVLIVRADAPGRTMQDFAGGTFAYNEPVSQSGWAAPMTYLNGAGVAFKTLIQTGAHAASARAVAEGRADMAGIDALTWALMQEHEGFADKLQVIATTPPTPGLPYITALGQDADRISHAVNGAITDLSPADSQALHLKGLVAIPTADYLSVQTPPDP